MNAGTASASRLRFFEMYEDEAAYRAPIASPLLRRYATATDGMSTARRRIDTAPIRLSAKER